MAENEAPWEVLEDLVREGTAGAVRDWLNTQERTEAILAVSRLPDDARVRLVEMLEPEHAAEFVEMIPDVQAVELLQTLEPEQSAAIIQHIPSSEQADLLGDLDKQDADAIIAVMDPEEARQARRLTRYDDDVAGGLMITEHLTYPESTTAGEVLEDLQSHAERYRDYQVQYAYVTRDGRLRGVLRLRDLFFASRSRAICELMRPGPVALNDRAPLDELRDFFDHHPYYGAPVIDAQGRLVGIVTRAAVEEALGDQSSRDYLKTQGIIGGEELRTMPTLVRSRRRLAWLSVNIGLNILAASIIALYQDTLTAVIALAVFLPIISDMSGCSGNQAVAVSLRELASGLLRPTEVLRVWMKELSVGVINGLALGALIAVAAWLWKGNPFLGVVVGSAMAINTVVAVSIGGTIPLILRRLEMDPALASGPILTTVTDMCGFLLLLGIASAAMPLLTAGG